MNKKTKHRGLTPLSTVTSDNCKYSVSSSVLCRHYLKFDHLLEAPLPLAKSSSSFLFVEVEGSFATNAGLAFACSAACEKIQKSEAHTCDFEKQKC